MERSIPNNDAQLPSSPKKKLHTKDKGTMADTITNARASLKNGKDISARNLMECSLRKPLTRGPSFEFDPNLAGEGSESTAEEIVALDEEHTDFLSTGGGEGFNDEDDDESIEEIVEEYYEEELVVEDDDDDYSEHTEESLEPLPPPIVIPKSLRVKDSDEEEEEDNGSDDDSDDEDDSLPSTIAPPIKQQPESKSILASSTASSQSTVAPQPAKQNTSYNGVIAAETKKAFPSTLTTNPKVAAPPIKAATNSDSSSAVRPEIKESKGASSTDVDNEIDRKVSSDIQGKENDTKSEADANEASVWEKPEWTKNTRLKATGVSPARNLAKPITQLPAMVSKKDMNEIKTPKKSNTMQAKLALDNTQTASMMKYPKSPASTPKVSVTSVNAPKSAPQLDGGRKKYVVPTPPTTKDDSGNDDDFSSKIAWEKPEWAKKKVLRKTSKTETILSGGKLERPIGGIRPIE